MILHSHFRTLGRDINFTKHLHKYWLYKIISKAINNFRIAFKLRDSDTKLVEDVRNFWRPEGNNNYERISHWKGNAAFKNENKWWILGRENLDRLYEFSDLVQLTFPVNRIIEWGSGGGANAIHFASLCNEFIGVEISENSLEECERQMYELGLNNFKPFMIDPGNPESILNNNIGLSDLFICVYVFEAFPGPHYGLRIMKIAKELLKEGGVAYIQIRYNEKRGSKASYLWRYKRHFNKMNCYSIPEFWHESQKIGFKPMAVYLRPEPSSQSNKRYAYFFLKKEKNAKDFKSWDSN